MLEKLNEKAAHYLTVTVLSILLAVAAAITIAQDFTMFILYDKYQKVSAAYTALATRQASLGELPMENLEPDFLYAPVDPQFDSAALAVKNKNPMNIKTLDNDVWAGQIGEDAQGHAMFSSWEYGVRAGAFTLRSYAQKHNVDTVDKLVDRFAEAKGQRHTAYVLYLCQQMGVDEDEKISLIEHMPKLLRAMSKYESGLDLPEELFVSYDVVERIR